MAEATEHLIGLGHRRVGFLGGLERYEHVQARLRGVARDAGAPPGLEPGPVAFGDPDAAARRPAAADRGRARATCWPPRRSAAARDAGIAVPGELSITGFDDSPLAALASPPLTSVRIDYAQFGEAAAAALLAAIAGEEAAGLRRRPAASSSCARRPAQSSASGLITSPACRSREWRMP